MTARDIALCVTAAGAVLSVTGIAVALAMARRKPPGAVVVLMVGVSLTLGVWALAGLGWYLTGGGDLR